MFNKEFSKRRVHRSGLAGFSLIELLITVAIIAILTTTALPLYSNYTKKAYVSQATSLALGFRTAVLEHYAINNDWPASNAELGLSDVRTDVVAGLGISTGGAITVTFTSKVAKDKTLTYTPSASSGIVTWQCSSSPEIKAYLPPSCNTLP